MFVPSPKETRAHRTLAALAVHRQATGEQLHRLVVPDSGPRALVPILAQLAEEELIGSITLPNSGRKRAWFLTHRGAGVCRDWPELRGRQPLPLSTSMAASMRAAHTLTVVRTHLAFLDDAREQGDEYGPLDWVPEVAHNVSDGERLVADALMRYVVLGTEGRVKLRAFVEVDRATMSGEDLAAKLIAYARFHTYTPPAPGGRLTAGTNSFAWLRWYPTMPRVLFVLTGAGPRALANRLADLREMAAEHPLVAAMAAKVPLGAAVLEDVEEHGARAAVWTSLAGPEERCGWDELKPASAPAARVT
ncbi:replication-relaxation family protein [Streptomyces koyangensis]|uniref:replication-relaxation family protein n=1 Tax=Streptomyces koyangensis TaxID=188770 RepID=UPI003650C3F5